MRPWPLNTNERAESRVVKHKASRQVGIIPHVLCVLIITQPIYRISLKRNGSNQN